MDNEVIVLTPEVQERDLPKQDFYSNQYTQYAKARNTIDAYKSDWADFHMWCLKRQCRCLPAAPRDVADYLEDRATNSWTGPLGKARELKEIPPLKWNTLTRRLTTICKMHQHMKLPFNRKDPAIANTLSGIKRKLSEERPYQIIPVKKDPTLIEDIRKMIDAIPVERNGTPHLAGIRDRALLLIGFAGARRRSEIVKIRLDHLKFVKEGIELLIPWSKTGRRDIAIPYGSDPETCPVRALQDWIQASGIKEGPVFRAINKWGQIQENALTDKSVSLIVKRNGYIQKKIQMTKEENKLGTTKVANFGGHSLRAGFATQAHLNGASEHSIMIQGGWEKRDTLDNYIRTPNKWKENAATKLGL